MSVTSPTKTGQHCTVDKVWGEMSCLEENKYDRLIAQREANC